MVRFGHVSCQHHSNGYYAAYADLAAHELDAVIHCGDYIYESTYSAVRDVPLPEPVTLEQYRNVYALYKGDPDLQAAHAAAPWIVTWDDHEVEDNYKGTTPGAGSRTPDTVSFLARRAAAYRAWWEHMPVRLRPPTGPDSRIYREVGFGDLARVYVLDTRQYRTDQSCAAGAAVFEDVGPRYSESYGPDFTVLGTRQERWLDRALGMAGPTRHHRRRLRRRPPVRWNVLAQQIVVQQWRFAAGDDAPFSLDQWDGYPAARDRLLGSLSGVENAVVLTGDVHSSWVADLGLDFDDPASEVVGTEFVATSVSSSGSALEPVVPLILSGDPHIRWGEAGPHGWNRHEVTRDEWRAEHRYVDDVTVPGSPTRVGRTWVLPAGGRVAEA